MDKVTHPIFERYTLSELARRLDRSEGYLLDMRRGKEPAGPRFRAMAASILRKPEAELFAPEALGKEQ